MSNFDIKRFARTAMWTWQTNFKGALSFAAGLSFGYIWPYIGWIYSSLKGIETGSEERLVNSISTCILIYLFVLIICGSWIFADMKTKAKRTMVKLLPASDLEKFLVHFLAVTLGAAIMGVVAFCLADLLRILVCLIIGIDHVGFGLPYFIMMSFTDAQFVGDVEVRSSMYPAAVNFAALCWCVWAQSLYILGGTVLRRYQFAITSTVHILVFIALSLAISAGCGSVKAAVMDSALMPAFYAAGAVLAGLAVVNWWLSYRSFKRMQVIDNKWISL